MIDITLLSGEKKSIILSKFSALEGWEIQNEFIDFAASTDGQYRRDFTLKVLSYANVKAGEIKIPLTTGALIDNHLQTWQNIKIVFEEVLMLNGIDPKTHADKPNYWAQAGSEMAVSFIAESAKLMGPALYTLNEATRIK